METVKRLIGWLKGLFCGLWHLLVPGAGSLADAPEHLQDAQRIVFVIQPVIVLGLIAIVIDCKWFFARGIILAAACLASGFLVGFLFGIPKVFQGDVSDSTGTGGSNADYQQRVNTNLVEISDWLTKIIVGLGLYELKQIPTWIGALAGAFASGMPMPNPHGVFGAAIVFFFICGFLLGYLVTRLYLQGALGRADRAAGPDDNPGPKKQSVNSSDSASLDDELNDSATK